MLGDFDPPSKNGVPGLSLPLRDSFFAVGLRFVFYPGSSSESACCASLLPLVVAFFAAAGACDVGLPLSSFAVACGSFRHFDAPFSL